MRIRPVDSSGEVLPVLHISDLSSDAEAAALLVKDRLSMHFGEWWENPSWGFLARNGGTVFFVSYVAR